MKTPLHIALILALVAPSLSLAAPSALFGTKPKPSQTGPAPVPPAAAAPAQGYSDPAPAPVHPDAEDNFAEAAAEATMAQTGLTNRARFLKQYEKAGSPRVIVLFNREFGSQITRWTSNYTEVIETSIQVQDLGAEASTMRGLAPATEGGGSARTAEDKAAAYGKSSNTQQRQATGRVYDASVAERAEILAEYLRWNFEQGFMEPMLEANVRLVDPDFIIQSTQRERGVDPEERRLADINANIQRLQEHAEILIEVLMIRRPDSAIGYEFKAVAKRLENGEFLGQELTDLKKIADRTRTKVTPTSSGYQISEEAVEPPSIDIIANGLAATLLTSIAERL